MIRIDNTPIISKLLTSSYLLFHKQINEHKGFTVTGEKDVCVFLLERNILFLFL